VKSHLLFTAAALACAAAFAQAPAEPPQNQAEPSTSAIFDGLDSNKDGRISSDEAQAHPVVSQSFGTADKNGDGAITLEEFNSSFTTRTPAAPPPSVPPAQSPQQ
jgi:Ca2+-binding EF-hand superfamily protein